VQTDFTILARNFYIFFFLVSKPVSKTRRPRTQRQAENP